MRSELGAHYRDKLWKVYSQRVPAGADLVCYFLEKARTQVESNQSQRVGLLATNSIRGGANRRVLERIKQTGDIFLAWNDEPWVLDGAAVRISIVGFDNGRESLKILDGETVEDIHSDLTSSVDITSANRLRENKSLGYLGVQKGEPFDIPFEQAAEWIGLPRNPNGRPNSDVIKPRLRVPFKTG